MNRRLFLGSSALAAIGLPALFGRGAKANEGTFEIMKTEAEWRAILSPEAYAVLREEDTERPFTSPLNDEKREGMFYCTGCDLAVFDSKTKYDSGTGWPSFYQPLENAIGTKEDNTFFTTRTEVHCRRCGGHFGHVFDDGPQPTGLRYCMNGLALTFKPKVA